jgi:hypothetical protein
MMRAEVNARERRAGAGELGFHPLGEGIESILAVKAPSDT